MDLIYILFKTTLSNNHKYIFKVMHMIDSKDYSLKSTP